MTGMELIRHRRSVRTFDGNALREEDAEKLMNYAGNLGNPFDLPISWRILNAKENGLTSQVIVGAETFIAGKMKRAPHAEEAFGYAFEDLVLYAESLGLGTTIIAGTMNRQTFERVMEVGSDEVLPCVSPLGYPAQKMSMREGIMRKSIKADTRLDFENLFFDKTFDTPLTPAAAGSLAEPLEMVRWAPSAVNKQPWRIVIDGDTAHFYEKKSRGYVDGSGWDLQKIDIGIAMYHFAFGLKEQERTVSFAVNDPGLAAGPDTEYIISGTIA